jgi:hypothetical protein
MDAELKLANVPELSGLKFPLSEEKLAEIVQALRKRNDLPRPSRPEPPRFSSNVNPAVRFQLVKQYHIPYGHYLFPKSLHSINLNRTSCANNLVYPSGTRPYSIS